MESPRLPFALPAARERQRAPAHAREHPLRVSCGCPREWDTRLCATSRCPSVARACCHAVPAPLPPRRPTLHGQWLLGHLPHGLRAAGPRLPARGRPHRGGLAQRLQGGRLVPAVVLSLLPRVHGAPPPRGALLPCRHVAPSYAAAAWRPPAPIFEQCVEVKNVGLVSASVFFVLRVCIEIIRSSQ